MIPARKYTLIFILLTIPILASFCTDSPSWEIDNFNAEVAVSWNRIIMETAVAEDGLLTLKGVRTEALVGLAMHDVLNTIEPLFFSYSYKKSKPYANPISASAQAAYEIAINQFPGKHDHFNTELSKWLASVEDGQSKTEGIELGKAVASHLLNARANDQWDASADYVWQPMAPGVYAEFNEHSGTPEGFIFGAGWAVAEPFMLKSQHQFRSPPPPAINSEQYTEAFNEVKEFGSYESKLRTKDQTHLAMWWKDFVENSHNRLARKLVVKENLNLWEAARVFALLNTAIFDAYVNVFDNKFHYNHWRPYTAIRWASNDENPNTTANAAWNNLHKHTYAFPSYPSAHGCASAAAMTVLANTLGTGDEYQFTMTTEEVDKAGPFSVKVKIDPPTRTFNSFSQASMEAAMSRVYLGIHFRYDSEEGYKLGNKIGDYASQNFLKPVTRSALCALSHMP